MVLAELLKKSVELKMKKYCERKVRAQYHDRLRRGFKIRGNSVFLYEERPAFGFPEKWVEIPIAQFRYNTRNKTWTLYCMPRSGKWELYLEGNPTKDFDKLLKEVEEDGTGIFWG